MKPHCFANQLLWALVLVVVVDLNEVCQDLQSRQEISWILLCLAVPLHHIGFVPSTSASLVLLLFIGGCQNIHTCWLCLCKCKETMP